MKEFVLNEKDWFGILNGQKAYKKIKNELVEEGNRIVFPEKIELLPSFIRGFIGQREENMFMTFFSKDPKVQEILDKYIKDFAKISMDPNGFNWFETKKKNKRQG